VVRKEDRDELESELVPAEEEDQFLRAQRAMARSTAVAIAPIGPTAPEDDEEEEPEEEAEAEAVEEEEESAEGEQGRERERAVVIVPARTPR